MEPFHSISQNEVQQRDLANAWIARFAPLVLQNDAISAEELHRRIELTHRLKDEYPGIYQGLLDAGCSASDELSQTLQQAAGQLESIEADLRNRLGAVAPGDPKGLVDLDVLQERLSERAARQEIGLPTTTVVPPILEMRISKGNIAGAIGLGVFGFGWTSFTTLHAVLMIGGFRAAIGWGALALLGFYSIFFLVGFGMLAGAFSLAASEDIRLEGNRLTVIRRLGPIRRVKHYVLAKGIRAAIGTPTVGGFNNQNKTVNAILMLDESGNQISLGSSVPVPFKMDLVKRINQYLAAQPALG